MNLISPFKSSTKKPTKSAPRADDVITPRAETHPANDIRDVDALAAMLQQLQTRNQQYQRAIDALVAARRIVNGWDPKPEPELIWSVRRDVLVAMGDQEALARFDQEHAQDLADEQAARQAANQKAIEAPTRVKALEQYITDLAAEMVRDVDEEFIFDEMKRLFQPSAQRMLTAAQGFAKAWQEMRTVESALKSGLRLTHYSVQGDRRAGYDMTLIGALAEGDLLPRFIEGLDHEALTDLNLQFRRWDDELSNEITQRLHAAGIPTSRLHVYHVGAPSDERPIFAPDPNPLRRRPQESPFGAGTVVTIHT